MCWCWGGYAWYYMSYYLVPIYPVGESIFWDFPAMDRPIGLWRPSWSVEFQGRTVGDAAMLAPGTEVLVLGICTEQILSARSSSICYPTPKGLNGMLCHVVADSVHLFQSQCFEDASCRRCSCKRTRLRSWSNRLDLTWSDIGSLDHIHVFAVDWVGFFKRK